MKTIIAVAVLILFSAGGSGAEKNADSKPAAASASGLSPLAEKYARKREAVLQEFAAKRRALIASPQWKSSSPGERKAALDSLAAEAKARDESLISDYDAELRGGRAAADADAAKVRQDRQTWLDEDRARAAQDALRSKTR
jgi:hypothetical protein